MANLIAGEKVVEELLQDEVTPTRIAAELKRFLGNPDAASRTRNKLAQVRLRLEQGRECGQTAAGGAAQMVAELLKETAS
jgi:lipid-A-disaccharide synthase